jgi:superfamily II DNA or RNA helicase
MQRAKLFAYVNNNIQITWKRIKRILQDKQFHLHVQLKSEQKEIIQNVLERKNSMAGLPTGFGKTMCYVLPPLILDKVRSYMQIISHDTLQ